MSAPSGGGKTAGSLILAYGILKGEHPEWSDEQIWEKIAIVDTENGSGELYSNAKIGTTQIGEYQAVSLEPPYEPQKFIEAITVCRDAGIEVCIVDSLSHAWSGQGGLLEKQGNVAKRVGNSYTAWREVTPLHNSLVDTILQTDMHIICTMRSKTEYVQEKDDRGKTVIRKVGLAPVQRNGMEYEFTMFLEIDADHKTFASKDRTSTIADEYFTLTPEIGKRLAAWLDGGAEPTASEPVKPPRKVAKKPEEETLESFLKTANIRITELQNAGISREEIAAAIDRSGSPKNYNKIKDVETAKKLVEELNNIGGSN